MPKTITIVVENDNEVWECAYESFAEADKDAIEHLEDIRRQSKTRFNFSGAESRSDRGITKTYTLQLLRAEIITLRLIPLTLVPHEQLLQEAD